MLNSNVLTGHVPVEVQKNIKTRFFEHHCIMATFFYTSLIWSLNAIDIDCYVGRVEKKFFGNW